MHLSNEKICAINCGVNQEINYNIELKKIRIRNIIFETPRNWLHGEKQIFSCALFQTPRLGGSACHHNMSSVQMHVYFRALKDCILKISFQNIKLKFVHLLQTLLFDLNLYFDNIDTST